MRIWTEEQVEVLYEMWEKGEEGFIEMSVKRTEVFIDEIGGFDGSEQRFVVA